MDLDMPEIKGTDLCRPAACRPALEDAPCLVPHRSANVADIQALFAAGADDYVSKPVVGPELVTRITNRLERVVCCGPSLRPIR